MRISITIILLLFVQLLQAQFAPGKILAEIGDPWDLELGDFNNDGFMDVIFSSTHDSLNLYLLLNDTQSGFNPPIAIIEEEGGDGYYFAVGELNNDGNLDVIGHGANGTYVFYGNGDGSFQSEVVLDGFAALPRNYMIIADVDNNGHQDIISSYGGFSLDGAVQWISNNGNGDFEDTENLFEDLPKSFFIEVADLDGDEFPEILVSSETPNPLFYFEYNGVDGFERTDVVSGMNNAGRFHIQDLNDDGLQDILVGEESSSELYFHFQAQPTNDTYYGFEILEMEKTTFGMDVGDLNGDGLIDFVTGTSGTTSGAGKVYFYPGLPLNDRRPDFDDPIILLEDISTRDLEVVDIDNDNDLDIIVSSRAYSWQNVLTENQIVLIQNLANDIAISGFVYHDENVDGSFDSGEQIIQNTSIFIDPTATAVFTQSDGIFNIYVAEGTYEIAPNYGKCYGPSSQPETITVDFDGVNHIDDLEFGLEVISNEENLDISMASAPTRCGFQVPFWLNYNNTGCQTVNGRVTLRRSDLANLISVETPPTDSDTDSWTWDFSDLAPGQQERISFVFEIADASFIGDTIYMPADLFIDTGSDYDFIERYNFSSEVNCAYDPNDKQSYPQRSTAEDYDQNYTLFDETIDYTIRFQNTGTDTAFNIVIRDTLSTDLEIGTLNPLGASHPMQPEIDYTTNSVAFYFRDIQLVDSFTNEALSHGFVQFSIKTLPGIAEETLIENKAGIYFDFNEPIITNTVDNLMVSELPTSSISESSLSLGAFPLFPNPVGRLESFMISELPEGEKKIKILNVNSELVYQTETGTDQFEFNNLNLNAGVFFILVEVKGNTWIEKLIVLK